MSIKESIRKVPERLQLKSMFNIVKERVTFLSKGEIRFQFTPNLKVILLVQKKKNMTPYFHPTPFFLSPPAPASSPAKGDSTQRLESSAKDILG